MLQLTEEGFDRQVLQGQMPAVVMFYEKWCPRCSMARPAAEEIERRYQGRILFFEVEVTKEPGLAARFGADLVPAFLFVRKGAVAGIMKGTAGEQILEKRVKELL